MVENGFLYRSAAGLYLPCMSEKSWNERSRKAMNTEAERVTQLASRPYRKVISGDEIEGFLAEAPELPGCVTAAASVDEALEMLRDAMEGWIEAALAAGDAIPEPAAAQLTA